MGIKITEKDKKFLSKLLKNSLNEIDNIYKFEGYIVGSICSEEMLPPSAFMEDIFGGPDDEDAMSWDSLDQVNQFISLQNQINNKSVTKLKSNIYRPMFAKTKEQVRDYAFGFAQSFQSSQIGPDDDYGANLAYMIICSIFHADEKLYKDDPEYAKLITTLENKPIVILSEAVQGLNNIRLKNYVAPQDIRNNVFDFEDINKTYH